MVEVTFWWTRVIDQLLVWSVESWDGLSKYSNLSKAGGKGQQCLALRRVQQKKEEEEEVEKEEETSGWCAKPVCSPCWAAPPVRRRLWGGEGRTVSWSSSPLHLAQSETRERGSARRWGRALLRIFSCRRKVGRLFYVAARCRAATEETMSGPISVGRHTTRSRGLVLKAWQLVREQIESVVPQFGVHVLLCSLERGLLQCGGFVIADRECLSPHSSKLNDSTERLSLKFLWVDQQLQQELHFCKNLKVSSYKRTRSHESWHRHHLISLSPQRS